MEFPSDSESGLTVLSYLPERNVTPCPIAPPKNFFSSRWCAFSVLAANDGPTGAFELWDCRYVGLAKTQLQHIITAAAINVVRVAAWLSGKPLAQSRQSAFMRLAPAKIAHTKY